MRYRIEKAEEGKYNAIMTNPSFGYEVIVAFNSKEDAEDFLKQDKKERYAMLEKVISVSD